MKTNFKTIISVFAIALMAVSCSKDDDKNNVIIDPVVPLYFLVTCDITSSVPAFQYTTECGQGKVEVEGINDTLATIKLPAFPVKIEATMGGKPFSKTIEIGAMTIDSVKMAKKTAADSWTGDYRFTKGAFTTQAGEYVTTGSALEGYLNGTTLSLSITYRPGTMMQDVKSTFVTATEIKW